MARLAYLGAELNDPGPGVEWTARSTTWPTISSSIKRSGGYSVQVTSLVSATPKWLAYQYVAGGGTGPFYYRVYLRPETLPSAENTIIVLNDARSGGVHRACSPGRDGVRRIEYQIVIHWG